MKKEHLRELLQAKFCVENNKPIVIFGLGIHGGGAGVARFLSSLGFSLIITDMKTKEELSSSLKILKGVRATYVLGEHREQDFENAGLIVKNPAVPAHHPLLALAHRRGIPITNDADIFLTLADPARVIGITGTKGKTTTSTLIKHLLGPKAVVVGTPGVSFFDYFAKPTRAQYIVAEFSSFDLEYVSASPHIAVLTSLFPDHLNRYASFEEYARTKMNILAFQKSHDITFAWRSRELQTHVPKKHARLVWVADADKPSARDVSWRVSPQSAALAIAVAQHLGVSKTLIKKRLHSFKEPHHRLEIIRTTKKHIFIDDTTSTNPGSAVYSLKLLELYRTREHRALKLHIIVGGEDKAFPMPDIKALADALRASKAHIVALSGSMTSKLIQYIPGISVTYNNLQEAVDVAARDGGIVALIPGAASFNMFKNEFDRGVQFKKCAQKIRS